MVNILITGGCGFVGTNLVKQLHKYNNIIVIDNYFAGKHENEIEGVIYINNHTKNIFDIDLPFKPDLIFHLGEYSKITPSYNEVGIVFDLNILGSFNILEYAKKHNIPIV